MEIGNLYVVPLNSTGIVPERWRRRAEEPLGNAVGDPRLESVVLKLLRRTYCGRLSEATEMGIVTAPGPRRCMCGSHRGIPADDAMRGQHACITR